MGIYERQRHMHLLPSAGLWGDPFVVRPDAGDALVAAVPAAPVDDFAAADTEAKLFCNPTTTQDDVIPPVDDAAPSSDSFGHDDARPRDKVQSRLAQNREAARKSRLRKKAYIQNLETSRLKLAQLEQELTMARRHAAAAAGGQLLSPPPMDPRITAFELEYARWIEDQKKHAAELRAALHSAAPEFHLRFLVDAGLSHYDALFSAKSRAARADAFFVLSGVWRSPAERFFFLWIGGFRPSELLKVLSPQLDPLTDAQASAVRKLQNTARQLEDAFSQGLNKLQQTLVDSLMAGDAAEEGEMVAAAVGKLDDLVGFVEQADLLRQQTLRNMNKILDLTQAARGLLALAEYSQRLRALSSLWAARPREPA